MHDQDKGVKDMKEKAACSFVALVFLLTRPLWTAHAETTGGFLPQRWARQQGVLIDGMLWFAGHFSGDRAADLADRWNDMDKTTIDAAVASVTLGARQSHLIPAIVYATGDGHIHEMALKGAWQDRDLTAAAGAPAISSGRRPMAYRRSDGVAAVVYMGADAHIHEIYLDLAWQGGGWQEVWHWADLTAITGSQAAASNPYGYVRSDGISAVVYTGTDADIYELRLEGTWIAANLSSLSGLPAAYGDPVAYVRGDGVNAILCAGAAAIGGPIYELRLENGWQWIDIRAAAGAPQKASGLSAYVRSDGISTVSYAGFDGHVHDLRLENTWIWSDLTAISGTPGPVYSTTPRGYARGDGVNSIVYSASDPVGGHLYELWLGDVWHYYELTSVPYAALGYAPTGYVRADGISAVVYVSTDSHIHEIRLEGAWLAADLTNLAGAPEATTAPWPYNRSTIVRVYLPIVLRSW